jgi:hypothetical protein
MIKNWKKYGTVSEIGDITNKFLDSWHLYSYVRVLEVTELPFPH